MQPASNQGEADKKDRSGNSSLHLASQKGQTDAVRALVAIGAFVNLRNFEGETPLHLAAQGGHKAVVKILLDAGADPTMQDNNGATPCHLAASEGFLEIMELMSKRADIKKRIKKLHEAAEEGSIQKIKQLLQSNVPLDEKNERGETALYVATLNGHCKVADLLLQAGADPHVETSSGSTVLHAAAMSGLASIINKLCLSDKSTKATGKEKKDLAPKMKAPKKWIDIYKKCDNIELTDSEGEEDKEDGLIQDFLTTLFSLDSTEREIAAKRNLHEMLDRLDKRIDVCTEFGGGATLLHLAAISGAEDIVRILLQRKADVNARAWNGETPLRNACAGGSLEIVKALVEAGADPNVKDDFAATPLHWAVRVRSLPITSYLLSLGADPNAKDIKGNTPLHVASMFGAGLDVIRALCGAGADLRARNKHCLFPFSLARDAATFKILLPDDYKHVRIIGPFCM